MGHAKMQLAQSIVRCQPRIRFDLVQEGNRITGSIPPMSGAMSLMSFTAGSNRLTGPIPPDWWQLPALQIFSLAGNSLTGSIPAAAYASVIASANNAFQTIDFSNNQLTGTIPMGLISQPIREIGLSSNKLSGDLSVLKPMFNINRVRVDSNNLSGIIPSFLSNQLSIFSARSCSLTGTLPAGLLSQKGLSVLLLSQNTLSGPLPSQLSSTWQQLSNLDITASGLTHDPAAGTNSRGENLPEWLAFNRDDGLNPSSVQNLRCYAINSSLLLLSSAFVPPSYFLYQDCVCTDGYTLQRNTTNGSVSCAVSTRVAASVIALAAAVSGLVVLLLLLSYLFVTRTRWLTAAAAWKKRHSAPGKWVALVGTDIEGSTALYEWSQDIMQEAQDIHDSLLRSELSACFGYESATEGDSFQVAFHEVADAAQWALRVQQKLLVAPWSMALLQHPAASIKHVPSSAGQQSDSKQKQETILFRGLRIRMAIVYGKVDQIKVNKVSGRKEYIGDLQSQLLATLNIGHGGQILLSSSAYEGIITMRSQIAQGVAAVPDIDKLATLSRGPSTDLRQKSQSAAHPSLGLKSFIWRSAVGDEPPMQSISKPAGPEGTAVGPVQDSRIFSITDLSPLLRTRGKSETVPGLGCSRQTCESITIIDMGLHELPEWELPEQILQLTVPGLVERAAILPELQSCNHVGPGYFDAPQANGVLGRCRALDPLQPMTMVFCSMQGCKSMKAANAGAFERAMSIFEICMRTCLTKCAGYECQSGNGDCMLAFEAPARAAFFCILLQEILIDFPWDLQILKLPGCQPQFGPANELLQAGPGVSIGLYQGLPSRVEPHRTSGRADYFGPFVNRCARLCHAVSQSGQVVTDANTAEAILGMLTGSVAPNLSLAPATEDSDSCSRASSLAPPQQLLSHSSKRRTNMSRMSVELMHTGVPAPPIAILPGRKLSKMTSMPTLPSTRRPDFGEGRLAATSDHVALDLAVHQLPTQMVRVPGSPERQSSGQESVPSRLAEAPRAPIIPAVAAAIATSYFSELGLDDVPQIDVHHIGKVQLKGLSTALDVVHMSSKRLSQRKFISPSLSSKASFTGAGRGHVCSVLPPLGLGKGTSPSHGSKAEEVASVLIARDRRRLSQL
ncbi:hypothetical protein WJX84_002659 [Apatococcus fuscideae]|uniref:Adenylate cyclase n=1 Tax=Apatococcus fuscideae TaxID=2026836 RepID=A0AAW1TFI7_9CHLO